MFKITMRSYVKFTFVVYILFESLFLMGVIRRGFMLPNGWDMMQVICCLPYFLCSVYGIIFNPSSKPLDLTWLLPYYGLIALNWYVLNAKSKSLVREIDE